MSSAGVRATCVVGLAGAVGGALNAALCFLEWPVQAADESFRWHVIPAGAFHGGVLAGAVFGAGLLLAGRGLCVRIAAALPVAWIAGFVSWIPLSDSVFDNPWLSSFDWAFQGSDWSNPILLPFLYFGFVALLYDLSLLYLRPRQTAPLECVLFTSASGVLGSLYWWIAWESWYLSPLHGVIWGVPVGLATADALRRLSTASS